MKVRWGLVVVGVGLSVAVLSGCSGVPEPAVSTPVFGSEEQAFAAAEQTYRNYVDALNQVDLSDPATFEEVYRWTTGDANASARRSFSRMHADGWVVAGASTFDRIRLRSFYPNEQKKLVIVDLCIDVSDVRLTDPSGQSVVPDSRVNRQPVTVAFDIGATVTGLVISASETAEGLACN